MTAPDDGWFHLRRAGTSILVWPVAGVPVVHHWGADLGDLSAEDAAAVATSIGRTVTHSSLDRPRVQPLLPDLASGWTGTPALAGHRVDGTAATARFAGWTTSHGEGWVCFDSTDAESGLRATCRMDLDDAGVLCLRSTVTNVGTSDHHLASLMAVLPLAAEAREILDLTGRWTRERVPQRLPLNQGTWRREGRHGRTGHDAPLLTVAGTPSFTFRHGEVWGVHVAWSGDHVSYVERTPEGFAAIGGGELLEAGEVVLGPGESYSTPALLAGWSDQGLDGLSRRFHSHVRTLPHLHHRARPVVLNTWEAVYFDHDLATLTRLADRAAEVGVERFVLDDGWFRGRTDDRRALGDWTVDPQRWPRGLHPLVEHVQGLGLEFGLWVEPEMVNEDSDVGRAHPEWILHGRAGVPETWRHQQVLDLQHPAAYGHVRDALLALLAEYPIAFLKWDHNRDLVDAGHDGRHASHGQTLALYRLLDELTRAHPSLEIETCASGGGRVDLGILARTHRLWASDTNDALERLDIQRWTQLLVPPELVGQHVGPPTAHTTGRTHRLHFRAAVALLGHFGVEWDLLSASPEELAELTSWVSLHKQVRPLVASGTVVRGDHPDPALAVNGVVAEDRSEAWFVLAQKAASETTTPVPVRLPGLDPRRRYRLERADPVDPAAPLADLSSWWLDDGPRVLPGAALTTVGVRLPVLPPETARVLRLREAGAHEH